MAGSYPCGVAHLAAPPFTRAGPPPAGHRPKTATGSDDKPASPPAPSRPHVYSVAERAFRFMTEPKEALLLGKPVALKNQSIIISGESGAGASRAVGGRTAGRQGGGEQSWGSGGHHEGVQAETEYGTSPHSCWPCGGAGKTEASKYVMRYLITVANALHHDEGRQEQQHGDFIERCLLRSNIVLEAFGNAKTLRNDNSRWAREGR